MLLALGRASLRCLGGGLLACSATTDRARRGADRRSRAGVAGDRANRCTANRSPGRATDGSTFRRRIGLRLRCPRRGIGIRFHRRGIDPRILFRPAVALLLIQQLLVLRLVVAREYDQSKLARGRNRSAGGLGRWLLCDRGRGDQRKTGECDDDPHGISFSDYS